MNECYDAIVVGSGACGGWAAKELTEGGLRVALLEAGPLINGAAPATAQPQRQPIQSRCPAYTDVTSNLFVDDLDNPYSFPEDKPFYWIRGRQVGGRLHTWQRACPRMSDYELKAASRDGVGEDWPISYADLAPYYDRVERFLGVYGAVEQLPQMPDGCFLEPPPMTSGEKRFKSAVEQRWSTRRVTSLRIARDAPDATLAAALKTGRLRLCPDSIVRAVVINRNTGRARGVSIVDRVSGRDREVTGRVVVLCASAIESTRILLNSASADHPAGLSNSSGTLGRYLVDHVFGVGLDGVVPPVRPAAPERGSHGTLVPGFRNLTEAGVDFLRGYEMTLKVTPATDTPLRRLRDLVRPRPGNFVLRMFGEVLPRYENHVSVDRTKTDAWGIPVAHIDCALGDNELTMAADAYQSAREMVAASGFEIVQEYPEPAQPGLSTHELGTARMGHDPDASVLNAHNQSWDVSNLFVTDGACFTSAGYQNPTLTMMAITVRACDYIVGKLKRAEL